MPFCSSRRTRISTPATAARGLKQTWPSPNKGPSTGPLNTLPSFDTSSCGNSKRCTAASAGLWVIESSAGLVLIYDADTRKDASSCSPTCG